MVICFGLRPENGLDAHISFRTLGGPLMVRLFSA